MKTTQHILRELTSRGLRQADIRRKTGIPQARLSKWLAGQVPPSADDSLKLLALLEVTPAPAGKVGAANACPGAPNLGDGGESVHAGSLGGAAGPVHQNTEGVC